MFINKHSVARETQRNEITLLNRRHIVAFLPTFYFFNFLKWQIVKTNWQNLRASTVSTELARSVERASTIFPGQIKKQLLLYFLPRYVKHLPKRTYKLFEFSPKTNRKGLKTKSEVTLQWLRWTGFCYYYLSVFTIKATLFLENGL